MDYLCFDLPLSMCRWMYEIECGAAGWHAEEPEGVCESSD